jgi:hypothetical protein
MTSRAVLKWEVPVDDRVHEIGGGEIVSIACQYPESRPDVVMVWTVEERSDGSGPKRQVQVYGTGHPLSNFAKPLGSAIAAGGALVWHVMEMPPVPRDTAGSSGSHALRDTWP